MITKKTPEDFTKMREAGAILARILKELGALVAPGVSTEDLDDEAMRLMELYKAEPVLLGYHPEFAPRPYPAAICTSVNDVIVHGVPNENPIILTEGDIIGLDASIAHGGVFVDAAITVPVGEIDELSQKLLDITKEARAVGIKAAQPGNTVGDIGYAIQSFVKPYGFGIVEELCGHGIGWRLPSSRCLMQAKNK
jgi:methionyl aminopeptidase